MARGVDAHFFSQLLRAFNPIFGSVFGHLDNLDTYLDMASVAANFKVEKPTAPRFAPERVSEDLFI